MSKTVNGVKTEYFYNGSILAGQKTGDETLIFMYDNNGDAFGFIYNGEEYYYIKNVQNDIVAIADKNGTVVANYYYDAWGNVTQITGNTALAQTNPLRYRSYYYDSETGYYHLKSRYYNPELYRFINADSVDVLDEDQNNVLENNLFTYCLNSPVNLEDSNGKIAATAGVLTWGVYVGTSNVWNPVGWVILGTIVVTAIVVVGINIHNSKKRAPKNNPDPYSRPGQKKQGRERKNKARRDDNWVPRSKPKPQKKHTPGRGHRKYK